jgi:hypothetical protein
MPFPMSRITVAFSLAVLGLAASAAWLAYQLHAAREELSALRTGPAPAASSSASALPVSTPTSIGPPPASFRISKPAADPDGRVDDRKVIRAALESQIPSMRATLENPETRAAFLHDYRAGDQKSMPRLAEHLGLTEDEYRRLLDRLAEHYIRNVEAQYQCALIPNCDPMTAISEQREANRRDLSDMLGADKAQQFYNYRDNIPERRSVAAFRGDLPDSLRLSDAQSEKLVEVLGDERRLVLNEWKQHGAKYGGIADETGSVSIYYPSTAQSVEQRVAEATEYQRRQRERAAQVLTAGQLEAFMQRQKDMLDMARDSLGHDVHSEVSPD